MQNLMIIKHGERKVPDEVSAAGGDEKNYKTTVHKECATYLRTFL